jgi:hypothetical protein
MRLLFLSLVFFATSALGQTSPSQKSNDINSSGTNAQNSSVDQTNSWGTNIGTQSVTTNVTGGYGNNSTTTNPSTITAKVYNVPTMYAPGLTAGGSDVCLGSVSASGSILGLGLAGGATYVDENCVLLKNSQRMASLGFGNAAVVMMLQNKDIEKAIRTSNPSVYLQVSKEKLANLQAELDIAKELNEPTSDLEEKISKASKEVRIMARRVQASPDKPDKAVEIPSTLSSGQAKTANDPREILNR